MEAAPTPTPDPETATLVTESEPRPQRQPAPTRRRERNPRARVDRRSRYQCSAGPRIVSHEGVVRHVSSLITPTEYELYDPTTDINVNFLYTTTTNLDLSRYAGMKIIVTGEEGLAARWPDTPVLTIQRILVIDTNAAPQLIYRSPRAAGQNN